MTADSIRDRIATIASEAFGPFPVQTVEEDLTAIEQGIYEAGKVREEWRARAEKAEAENHALRRHLDTAETFVEVFRILTDVHFAAREQLRAESAKTERERDEARVELSDKMTRLDDASSLAGDLLASLRLASTTSDAHRDAHAAFQRWAAVHAPDAIGDEQKREAIDRKIAELHEECDLWRDDNVQRMDADKERDAARSAMTEERDRVVSIVRQRAAEYEHVDNVAQALEALALDLATGAPSRPPLDPALVEALRVMLAMETLAWEHSEERDEEEHRRNIAALTAVLASGAIDRSRRVRPLLDSALVTTLRGLRARIIDQLDVERAMEQHDDAYKTHVAALEIEVAALTAVLGETEPT